MSYVISYIILYIMSYVLSYIMSTIQLLQIETRICFDTSPVALSQSCWKKKTNNKTIKLSIFPLNSEDNLDKSEICYKKNYTPPPNVFEQSEIFLYLVVVDHPINILIYKLRLYICFMYFWPKYAIFSSSNMCYLFW